MSIVFLVVPALVIMMLLVQRTYADVGGEMDVMFGTMMTQSAPYADFSRGVISGGSFQVRNKVTRPPSLLAFTPPNADAGCGGIDMYGGSLSFVSADKMVEFIRQTAGPQVASYAFKVAIETMCPTCSQKMAELEKFVTKMNANMLEECYMYDYLSEKVGDPSEVGQDIRDSAEKAIVNLGYVSDSAAGANNDANQDATLGANDPDKLKEMTGNFVWKALKESDAGGWFAKGGDDFNYIMLSMVGTPIAKPVADGVEISNIEAITDWRNQPVQQLIKGGELSVWTCSEIYSPSTSSV